MLEKLQQKRALLVAQRDQLNANLNATLGAIAMVDELIGEAAAEASRALSSEELKPEPIINIDARGADQSDVEELNAAVTKAVKRSGRHSSAN